MNTRQRTEAIMQFVPKSRSDDKLLCVLFMQKSGLSLSEEQIEAFYKMDDLWTVRRCRQKIQEQGKYPATKEVEEKRYKEYVRVKHSIPFVDSPEPTAEVLEIEAVFGKTEPAELPNYQDHQVLDWRNS